MELLAIRKPREEASAEVFELMKDVEQARVEKRTAELSVQRMTKMISEKAAASALTKMPVLEPTPTKR
ncbi:MAG: hypothetical protein J6386_23200 [Candidatus Synoicihabitans palmerolidicus]|nr:hypothetical protein [Candidatus Synoicihabitans palmerolidicus]